MISLSILVLVAASCYGLCNYVLSLLLTNPHYCISMVVFLTGLLFLLKENDRLKFAQDVAFNSVREKGKPLFKPFYK